MNKQEIFEIIEANFNILAEEHVGTTKASQGRARKAAQAFNRGSLSSPFIFRILYTWKNNKK